MNIDSVLEEFSMRNCAAATTFRAALILGLCLIGVQPQVHADEATATKPLALRGIMQGLGKNMQAITDGISREDWMVIAKIAPLIAEHPQPPLTEKMRIMAFVGTDIGTFKGYDERTHQAARTIADAAVRRDGKAVIAAFASMQNSCLACHQSFRKPIVEHFYERP